MDSDMTNLHLILLQPVLNLTTSVKRITPFLNENQQLHDADNA